MSNYEYNFWDDRTHELDIHPCKGCKDFVDGECISNGGCGKARKIKTMSKPSKDYQRIINTLEVIAKDEQLASMEAKVLLQEAMDIIHDYEKVVADHNRMVEHYETEAVTIKRQAGVYVCPNCGKRVQVGHSHCHWCGKKVSWDREAYASRDYPHLGNRGGRNQ